MIVLGYLKVTEKLNSELFFMRMFGLVSIETRSIFVTGKKLEISKSSLI